MTEERIAELRNLCEAATPGEWRWHQTDGSLLCLSGPDEEQNAVLGIAICKACRERGAPCLGPDGTDAAFIAAARTALPELLDALDKAERDLRQLAELQAEHRREIEDKELQIAVLIAQLCPTQVDARKH